MPIAPQLLALLVCPACHGELDPVGEVGLSCRGCHRVYPVRDGIPVMIVSEASLPG